ncbi:MAG: mevalonate kinase [Thermosphaera sp.]
MICSVAPGKIILVGEHFVVKGAPAIGLAVSKYVKVCIEEGESEIMSRQLGLIRQDSPLYRALMKITLIVRENYKCSDKIRVLIDSEIPIGSGMGSSAAINVAFTHAYFTLCGLKPDKELVNGIAFEGEKEIHSKPSGIDNTLATYGGFIKYQGGVFHRINAKLKEDVDFVIVNTNIRRVTGNIVEDVLKLYDRYPEIFNHIYVAASHLVEEALRSLIDGDYESLGRLMLINHGLLWSIGVSHKSNDMLVHRLLDKGCYGAKLSGAGRGGIVIGLADRTVSTAIINELAEEGFLAFRVIPDYEGVKIVQDN